MRVKSTWPLLRSMDTARDEAAKAARLGFLMHAAHAALWSLCSSSERRARTAYARSMVFWADDKVLQFCRVQPAPFLNLPMQPLPLSTKYRGAVWYTKLRESVLPLEQQVRQQLLARINQGGKQRWSLLPVTRVTAVHVKTP